jgi:hypothetical protein
MRDSFILSYGIWATLVEKSHNGQIVLMVQMGEREMLCTNYNVELFEWLCTVVGNIDENIIRLIIRASVHSNNLEVIKCIHTTCKVPPDGLFNYACGENISFVEWCMLEFKINGLTDNDLIDTGFDIACSHNQLEIAQLIDKYDPTILELKRTDPNDTFLYMMCVKNNVRVARWLYSNGLNIQKNEIRNLIESLRCDKEYDTGFNWFILNPKPIPQDTRSERHKDMINFLETLL